MIKQIEMLAIKGNNPGSFADARQLEQRGELKAAAQVYQKLSKQSPRNLKILERLMIIYRKLKDPAKEISYIDAAIKIHEGFYTGRNIADKQTISISKKLNKLLGHTDDKGKAVFKPDEVLKLQIRKNRLLSKTQT